LEEHIVKEKSIADAVKTYWLSKAEWMSQLEKPASQLRNQTLETWRAAQQEMDAWEEAVGMRVTP
jgi:hypothetical protein